MIRLIDKPAPGTLRYETTAEEGSPAICVTDLDRALDHAAEALGAPMCELRVEGSARDGLAVITIAKVSTETSAPSA